MTAIDFMPKTIGAAFGMSDENGIWRTGRCAANGRFFVAVSIPHNSGIGLEELVIGSVIAFTSTWRLGAQSRGSSLAHHENLEVCSELPSPSLPRSFFLSLLSKLACFSRNLLRASHRLRVLASCFTGRGRGRRLRTDGTLANRHTRILQG